jgi:hypothetical protein
MRLSGLVFPRVLPQAETTLPDTSDKQAETDPGDWLYSRVNLISSGEEPASIDSALGVFRPALMKKGAIKPDLPVELIGLLTSNTREASGAAWGLALLNDDSLENFAWRPTETDLDQIISVVGDRESDAEAVRFLIRILGRERDRRAAGVLIARLEDQSELVLKAAVEAIGQIGESQAVEKLTVILQYENKEVRQEAAKALARIGNRQAIDLLINTLSAPDRDTRIEALEALSLLCKDGIDRKLLSEEFDAVQPFWDPLIEIDAERIDKATRVLKLPTEEVRARYEAIARLFPLKLEWQAIENV